MSPFTRKDYRKDRYWEEVKKICKKHYYSFENWKKEKEEEENYE